MTAPADQNGPAPIPDVDRPPPPTGPAGASADARARELVEHFFRHESARLVASLTRRLGVRRWELAEDVAQSALQRALSSWSLRGVPPNPAAWLHRVAYNLALDALRRDLRWSSLDLGSAEVVWPVTNAAVAAPEEGELQDDLLRMLFVCCDPAVPEESQVALCLKTLCGFSTQEIARALLTTEGNVAKRITRAKERLRGEGLDPSALSPDDSRRRLPTVQSVLYLMFNEGYSSSLPERVIREELCEEATRLAMILAEHPLTAGPSTAAFLSLLLFHAARLEERVDASGNLSLLEQQDRGRWDPRLLAEAYRWFGRATQGSIMTRYHAEAWIAAEHCRAPDCERTDWSRIVHAYDLLLRLAPSPIHELNRAIAVGRRDGPAAGLDALSQIPADRIPQHYHLWHATRAEFARLAGDLATARDCLERARDLAPTNAEQALLDRRLSSLRDQWDE